MKLRTLFSLFALSVAILVALTMTIFDRAIQSIEDDSAQVREIAGRVYLTEKLENLLRRHNREAFLFVFTKKQSFLRMKNEAREELEQVLRDIRSSVIKPYDKDLLQTIEDEVQQYFDVRSRIDESDVSAVDAYRIVSRYIDRIGDSTQSLANSSVNEVRELEERIARKSQFTTQIGLSLGGMIGLILLGALVVGYFFIYRPLSSISLRIRHFASGDGRSRLPLEGPVEFQELSRTFNSMADRLDRRKAEQLGFLASVAHDLRNPLNSVLMSSDLLINRCSDREEFVEEKKFLEIIRRQIKNLDRLVGDLLDTTRVESGHFDLKMTFCELGRLLRDVVNLHQTTSTLHNIKLDLPTEPIFAYCDVDRISQVIHNLISNAIKYSPNGGKIEVTAGQSADGVVVKVSDQGIGIESSDKDSIFEPFRRSEASRKGTLGIGLGLSTSRKIVEAHHGTLTFESQPGEGSVFILSLPTNHKTRSKNNSLDSTAST